jgi:hypothetical protein
VEPVDPQIDDRLDTINKQELVANLVLAEGRQAVHGGLAKLQAAQRDPVMLLFADPAISYRQISRRLGMPIESIGPTRARWKLVSSRARTFVVSSAVAGMVSATELAPRSPSFAGPPLVVVEELLGRFRSILD